eukprot:s161_g7.t1
MCLAGLTNLQTFDLSSNELSDLPAGVFARHRNLQELALGSNKLSALPVEVWANLLAELSNLQPIPTGCTSCLLKSGPDTLSILEKRCHSSADGDWWPHTMAPGVMKHFLPASVLEPFHLQEWNSWGKLKASAFFADSKEESAETIPAGKDCSSKSCKKCECARCPICPDCPDGFKPRDDAVPDKPPTKEKVATKEDNCPSCPECPPCPTCPKECQPCLPIGNRENFL